MTHRNETANDEHSARWLVVQKGAREHYAVARALHESGRLVALITDFWFAGASTRTLLPSAVLGRFHPDLSEANIVAANLTTLANEIVFRFRSDRRGARMIAHNAKFGKIAEAAIRRSRMKSRHVIVFAYSYAALAAFKMAKQRGCSTVLCQIDPGPVEEDIVAALHDSDHRLGVFHRVLPEYWELWREELELSDLVLANSSWSIGCLRKVGVDERKMRLVPVAYEPQKSALDFKRSYPKQFSRQRPLRALFLGQIGARKGAHIAYEACRLLKDEPVEVTFVGAEQLERPRNVHLPNIRWTGQVARDQVDGFYKAADVFLFPTFSDGFGITQLEAQSWRLPIITTRNCGEVVEHGRNGWLLDEITPEALASALLTLLRSPSDLAELSIHAVLASHLTLSGLQRALADVENELVESRRQRE